MLAFVASNARGHSAQPEGQDHGIIRTIHVRFPDERGDPAAPVISHKQDFIFPHRVHNLYMSGDIFIAEASRSVQLLNYATRAGVLLLFADDYELDSDAGLIFQISIHEQAKKLRINGGWLRGQDEPESQRRFVRRVIALANYPHDILDPRDSSLDEASDISWTSVPFQLTHLFNEPRWPAATIRPLPAGLLASAICIRDFEIVEPSVEEGEPEAQHYVSLLLHDDRLVAYETDTVVRPDPRGQPAVPDAGLASFEGPWEAPKDVIDVPILDSKTKQVKTMHLALPTHCARMLAYRVAGWDSLRGRLLLNAAFEFKENGSASRLLYAIQY
ncbi:hypothetical protein SISNIDRAFT_452305 [Sistotremastrum niveocremeum HHB9708]|uniref:Uncharacterized protein n=1 Tax=Sistotremastrum niveocremeum HHB9708 TaxID=1314777 RepID=A0A164X5F2_9AGAM|nr:hypothetical protein SISNIDRAFT_452305 [Sistotremastrum niveocremeum HHB9708]